LSTVNIFKLRSIDNEVQALYLNVTGGDKGNSSRVWKSIWVNILYGNYFTLLEYVRRLGQDSWSNLLYISVVWKDIWVKVLGMAFHTPEV
jgi:hypothetical protein